ncbi:hypothetical protein NKR23_g7899 [Pleurostoma richardsiae]|uniref:2EXR domain-containing protein n=1 Tax=Pleurostoma richardsiae TaxID=41990 RepID=A0AA38RUW1_9PEZI|nr:hypothetical protein NKR23_g7899 [Pleurostoma richardsiae]
MAVNGHQSAPESTFISASVRPAAPPKTPASDPRSGPSPPLSPSPLALSSPIPSFHLFPHLPAELRLQVWRCAFEDRIVELHARRSHYADDYQHGGVPMWQSRCTNPAVLSVNAEARAAALEHFTVRFPLATAAPCERAGDSVADLHRVLYVSPATDTVVMLGDIDFRRLSSLLSDFRRRDPAGAGLRRLAISARWTHHQGIGGMLRVFARTMFRDLEALVVFMFEEGAPPAGWAGGVCSLDDCSGTDYYRRYAMGRGQELKEGNSWMVIGEQELRVMDLNFRSGW